jgi:hypothetical protein
MAKEKCGKITGQACVVGTHYQGGEGAARKGEGMGEVTARYKETTVLLSWWTALTCVTLSSSPDTHTHTHKHTNTKRKKE